MGQRETEVRDLFSVTSPLRSETTRWYAYRPSWHTVYVWSHERGEDRLLVRRGRKTRNGNAKMEVPFHEWEALNSETMEKLARKLLLGPDFPKGEPITHAELEASPYTARWCIRDGIAFLALDSPGHWIRLEDGLGGGRLGLLVDASMLRMGVYVPPAYPSRFDREDLF